MLMRRMIPVLAAAVFMFWIFPHFPGSPLECIARHQSCATQPGHRWLMWTFSLLALWVLWVGGSALPGEQRGRDERKPDGIR